MLIPLYETPRPAPTPVYNCAAVCSRIKTRKTAKAKRACPIARRKITWWFAQQQGVPDFPTTPTTPVLSPDTIPPTPKVTPANNKGSKRKRGQRKKQKKRTLSPQENPAQRHPSLTPAPRHQPTATAISDASPKLMNRLYQPKKTSSSKILKEGQEAKMTGASSATAVLVAAHVSEEAAQTGNRSPMKNVTVD